MDLLTLLTLAVGLAMDAFAVSICKGLAMREKVLKKGIISIGSALYGATPAPP